MDDTAGLEGVSTDLEDAFGAAASFLASAVVAKDGRFDDKLKLQFYGLYKQATAGKCTSGKPAFWDMAGRAKWDAWAALGDLGKDDAMQRYVELLSSVAPGWDAGTSGSKPGKSRGGGGAMGPVFSSLAAGEEAEASGEGDDPGRARSLHELAGEGDLEAVAAALEAGADVNGRDESGCTPLHFAADRGAAEVAAALLAAGADVDAADVDGQTPLHYAAVTEHRELYELLVGAGADVSIRDSAGATAAEGAPAAWGLGVPCI
ncbi:hypothetical protein HYH02_007113 [Chlamydomonas schloesseri]|uniref:ACB domain-containing protein n=1 Tax=Chlamydomonas schloesseri TaxID=2026947 RepID=A0A836B5L8_9CHLO|nr:hypothetical protein HYH02_007113 [Chlamydomonas schloesseri]|eukprot:KAG2448088.1 hypothetical protein HYH02_007113 [Chlamydomonas schloesseri]